MSTCNNNKVLIVILIFIFSSKIIYSQNTFFLEFEHRFTFNNPTEIRPAVNIFGYHSDSMRKTGFFYWGSVNKYWAEGLGGLLVKPAKWIMFTAGIGLETNNNPYRGNLAVFLYKHNWSMTQWYEYGGTGFWYYVLLDYKVSSFFKPGILFERYYGIGPNFDFHIKKTPIVINIAPLYDYEYSVFRGKFTLRFVY